jgi:DNA-binding response OmpR family regulator
MGAGMSEAEQAIQIGQFELDPGRGLLLKGGQSVSTRARSFALLAFLARNANRVVGSKVMKASLSRIWCCVRTSFNTEADCR